VIRIGVNLVQVDPVVTDSKNKNVRNLKAENFEILQDGKPQKPCLADLLTMQMRRSCLE
jgi:hypothetical protein